MNKRIIYDCDEILLNWFDGFRNFLLRSDGIKTNPNPPSTYDMMDWIGTNDRDFILNRITRFNSNEGDFFANLTPLPGAVSAVNKLREAKYETTVITACGTNPKTIKARKANLKNVFGQFDRINCIDLGASKYPLLIQHEKSWLIDDHIEHAESGVNANHITLLMNTKYNQSKKTYEDFTRIKNWKEAYQTIRSAEPNATTGLET